MLCVTRRCLQHSCAVANSANATTAILLLSPPFSGRPAFQLRQYATPTEMYAQRLASGELKNDATQKRVVADLQKLYKKVHSSGGGGGGGNILTKWFSSGSAVAKTKGLYIHGSVGGGKTTLMDLFYDCCTVIA